MIESDSGANETPKLAAVCGLYCRACTIYIASQEDPKRLKLLASRHGWSEEETYCEGCRSGKRTIYCRSCTLFACAAQRGLAFCGECHKYPCADLQTFGRERPHRANITDDMRRIGEIGAKAWMAEADDHYSCPECGTINSAYDLGCRRCGRDPANAFVAEHREAITERLSQL
ncbi:MAG: DUF3795 domain-containing protein [bacterium]